MLQAPSYKPFPHKFSGKYIVMYLFFFQDAKIKVQVLINIHYISDSSSSGKISYSLSQCFSMSLWTLVISWFWAGNFVCDDPALREC